jgi:membrane protein YdbS with pleckstrin-like domain
VSEEESKDERLDRELLELLNELRVALPGVQMLFGFLLALPFSVGFEHVSAADRRAYFVSFLAAAAASIFLIAPSAYHRLMWRQRDKEHLLRISNGMAIAGTACLAIAVSTAVYVVTSALYSSAFAASTAAVVAAATVVAWYALPLVRRLQG